MATVRNRRSMYKNLDPLNPIMIAQIILDHYKEKFPPDETRQVSVCEKDLAFKLIDIIERELSRREPQNVSDGESNSPRSDGDVYEAPQTEIDFDEAATEAEPKAPKESRLKLPKDDDFIPDSIGNPAHKVISFSYKVAAVNYWKNEKGRKKRKFSSVSQRYRLCKDRQNLSKWERELNQGKTSYYQEDLKVIRDHVVSKYQESKDQGKDVTIPLLKKWAEEKSLQIGRKNFKASQTFIHKLKNDFKMVLKSSVPLKGSVEAAKLYGRPGIPRKKSKRSNDNVNSNLDGTSTVLESIIQAQEIDFAFQDFVNNDFV